MEGETKEKKKRRQRRVLEGPGDSEEVSDMNKMVAKATVFLSFLSVCLSGAVRKCSVFFFFSMCVSLILSFSLSMYIDIMVRSSHQIDTLSTLKA